MIVHIRPAEHSDLTTLVEILNPFILSTAVTFDTQPYTAETRLPWFQQFDTIGRHQCLVATVGDRVVAYANSGPLRPKAAYDTSVEISVYRSPECTLPGIGSALYEALFANLAREDVHRAHALITLPNDASIALHKKFGFYNAGLLDQAGRKFGQYHSVQWMEKKVR